MDQNPYTSPRTSAPPPRLPDLDGTRGPSKVARVIGVLSIVFAVLNAAPCVWAMASENSLTQMLTDWFKNAPPTIRWRELLAPALDRFQIVQLTEAAIYIAMSAVLVIIGIGQYGVRRWARRATLVWALLAIAVVAAFTALDALVVRPALRTAFGQATALLPTGLTPQQRMSFLVVETLSHWILQVVIFLPYPVILAIVALRSTLKPAGPSPS